MMDRRSMLTARCAATPGHSTRDKGSPRKISQDRYRLMCGERIGAHRDTASINAEVFRCSKNVLDARGPLDRTSRRYTRKSSGAGDTQDIGRASTMGIEVTLRILMH